MNFSEKFSFLYSVRFWQLFIVGVSAGLTAHSNGATIEQSILVALGIWMGGSVVVRTVDKVSEKK